MIAVERRTQRDGRQTLPLRDNGSNSPEALDKHLPVDRMPRTIDLSVIMPTYRDGPRIFATVERFDAILSELAIAYEIVVVSDGNTDSTAPELARLAQKHPHIRACHYTPNQGKGYALAYGVAHSHGDMVTFIDGDGDIDPRQIALYLDLLQSTQSDIVVGSKRHPQSTVVYPGVRRLYSWGYQTMLRLCFDLKVRDTQVGLKVFHRDVLEAVLPRIVVKRYAFDLELLVVAHLLGYRRITEAPVQIGQRFSSTINWRAVWNMVWDTAAIFYRKNILHYYDRMPQTALADAPLLIRKAR